LGPNDAFKYIILFSKFLSFILFFLILLVINIIQLRLFNRINVLVWTRYWTTLISTSCIVSLIFSIKECVNFFIIPSTFDGWFQWRSMNNLSSIFAISINCLDGYVNPLLDRYLIQFSLLVLCSSDTSRRYYFANLEAT